MEFDLRKEFAEVFGDADGVREYFSPGRVNLIGEHTDYNGGHVFPCALTIGTYAVARKRTDDIIRFYSANVKGAGVVEVSRKELKNKKRYNGALRFIVYGVFIITGAIVFYMYQMDKYEFYPKKEEILIANESKYQIEITPKNAEYFDYLNYRYEIEDEKIAEVNEYGEIRAKSVGETKLKNDAISISGNFTKSNMPISTYSAGSSEKKNN